MGHQRYSFLLMVLAFGALIGQSAFADNCSEILAHGIWDKNEQHSQSQKASAFLNWLSQSDFSTYGQARDTAASLGFPIDGLPVSLSSHDHIAEWKEYQKLLHTLQTGSSAEQDALSRVVTKANAAIVKAWSDCVQTGFFFWTEIGDDPTLFTINVIYKSKGEPYEVPLTDVTIRPTKGVSCTPNIQGMKVGSGGIVSNCTRQSTETSVQLTINTDNHGSGQSRLSGIPKVVEQHTLWRPPSNCTEPDYATKTCRRCQFRAELFRDFNDAAVDTKRLERYYVCPQMPPGATFEAHFEGLLLADHAFGVPTFVRVALDAKRGHDDPDFVNVNRPNYQDRRDNNADLKFDIFDTGKTDEVDGQGITRMTLWICQAGANIDARCSVKQFGTLEIAIKP